MIYHNEEIGKFADEFFKELEYDRELTDNEFLTLSILRRMLVMKETEEEKERTEKILDSNFSFWIVNHRERVDYQLCNLPKELVPCDPNGNSIPSLGKAKVIVTEEWEIRGPYSHKNAMKKLADLLDSPPEIRKVLLREE